MQQSDEGPSDLPQVYDLPSDDEASRQIRKRVGLAGWLLAVPVLAVLGGTGYYVYSSAQTDAQESEARTQGRRELDALLQQNLPNEQTAERVRAIYQSNHNESVRQSCRRILAGLKDPQSVPLLIEGLRVPGASRAQAALGLAEIGLPAAASARGPLLAALPTTNPQTDKVEVAWALAVLQEPSAWPTVRELLEEQKLQAVQGLDGRRIFDPAVVARMAGRERLHELVSSQSVASKRLAALSLSELGTPDVVDDLLVLVRDADESISREAAVGLGRAGTPQAVEGLVPYLNAHPRDRDGILGAVASSSGAQGLGAIIHGTTDPAVRATATRLLRDQQDPDAGDALAEAMAAATGDDELSKATKRNAIFGLAEIGDPRAVDGLMTYATYALTHLDPASTSEAKQALELIRRIPGGPARAKDGLAAIVRDPHGDFVRTPAILALARAGDPSVAPTLTPFLTQPDAQEGAATALCMLHHPACFTTVLNQAKQPAGLHMAEETVRDEEVFVRRRNAIRSLAWAGSEGAGLPAVPPASRAAVVRELRRIIEDATDRRSLREEAGYSLASVADDRTLEEIAARATDASVPEESRIYYIYALRGRSTPTIATRLVQTYLRRGVSPEVMKGAAIAAGFGGDETLGDTLAPLIAGADAQDNAVRFAASIAAVLGGNARSTQALIDALANNDELAGLLQNEFAPRGSGRGDNNTAVQENWALLPLTEAMFRDGRVFRRVQTATALDTGRAGKHYSWAQNQLVARLKAGWENALGVSAYDVRRLLREAALSDDATRRDMAFKALRITADRGSLHALHRQTRDPAVAERARRELLELSGGGRTGT